MCDGRVERRHVRPDCILCHPQATAPATFVSDPTPTPPRPETLFLRSQRTSCLVVHGRVAVASSRVERHGDRDGAME